MKRILAGDSLNLSKIIFYWNQRVKEAGILVAMCYKEYLILLSMTGFNA
ncbi:hypothetical protein [Agriterribacter sp.]|nr:hypothetical protein [Agriterribacter sp.]HTN06493.1 hypothetical protein [Agriterribacter sp.]